MSIEDGYKACGFRVEVELLHIMQQIEIAAGDGDNFSSGKQGAWAVRVDVAANGGDGSYLRECTQNVRIAHIAEVEDVIGAFEQRQEFGPEETMSVGEDANAHNLYPGE
jgi:hypothetical protein